MVNCLLISWILIRKAIIIWRIQHFEADFLWKVSLEILNSGIIVKTFTHGNIMVCHPMCDSSTFLLWIHDMDENQCGYRSSGFILVWWMAAQTYKWKYSLVTIIVKNVYQASKQECVLENYFLHFSSKTYIMGTQKNRLNETVLLRTQNTCLNWWVRKQLQFFAHKISLSGPLQVNMAKA